MGKSCDCVGCKCERRHVQKIKGGVCASSPKTWEIHAKNLEKQVSELTQLCLKFREALSDLTDGESWWDIRGETGLPEERCKEILELARQTGEKQ